MAKQKLQGRVSYCKELETDLGPGSSCFDSGCRFAHKCAVFLKEGISYDNRGEP